MVETPLTLISPRCQRGVEGGFLCARRWRKMQHSVRQPSQAIQTVSTIQIARHGRDACPSQDIVACRISRQSKQAVMSS